MTTATPHRSDGSVIAAAPGTRPAPPRRSPVRKGPPRSRRRPPPVRVAQRWLAIAGCLGLAASAVSFAGSVGRACNIPAGVRAVEWLRGHHYAPLVDGIESAWYRFNAPPTGGRPASFKVRRPAATAGPSVPPPVVPPVTPALPGEGVWQAVSSGVAAAPPLYVTYLRPDAVHTSLTAALVRITPGFRLQLVPGAVEPGGGPWPEGDRIPAAGIPGVVAAFNSGFRLIDSHGGFMADGRTVGALTPGAASLVIDRAGHATVGEWGRDVTLGPSVAAVRQNLTLIVDNGRPAAGLDSNDTARWGVTLGNTVLVWRSGIGVDRTGDLVYAAGPGLSVATLADLLARAGAVRAMQLDINHTWVTFNLYSHADVTSPSTVSGQKLLAGMAEPATRYLTPDDRDFVAVYAP